MRLGIGTCLLIGAIALGGCGHEMNLATGNDAGADLAPDGGTGPATPDLGGDAGHDVGPDIGQPSSVYPAPHPAAPQAVNLGGPVLASPVIVPIFFSNEDATKRASVEDFVSKIGGSSYWSVAEEYGVGAATATSPVELTETATGTIDDSAIQTWLAGKLDANDPAFPAATDNTIYLIYYPAGVTITMPDGMGGTAQSCTAFGGYHSSTTLDANHGSMTVVYAVIPDCPTFLPGASDLDDATGAASHELMEAATDPYYNNPAWAQVDDDHLVWMFGEGGGELGDLCVQDPESFTKFPGLDYEVQRIWSNAAAAAGHDPCVPALANEVYFNAVPELDDDIMLAGYPTKGVQVPIGSSKTIPVDLFSDGDTHGPFTVVAYDFAQLTGGQPSLELTLDRASGQNGQKLHLTIKALSAPQSGVSMFLLVARLGQQAHLWLGAVGN